MDSTLQTSNSGMEMGLVYYRQRIINYTSKGNLIISWMEISDSLEGILRTRFDSSSRPREVEQRCEFQLEQHQGNHYLHIFGFLGDRLHNYAVYDLNYHPKKANIRDRILLGSFCSCRFNGRDLAARHLMATQVMTEGTIRDTDQFPTRRLLKEEIEPAMATDQQLALLVEQLDDHIRRA